MMTRFVSLIFVLATMGLVVYGNFFDYHETLSPTLILGFLLLAAYCAGVLFERVGLPLITGYIFAGLLLGPCFLNFYSEAAVLNLGFINSLALAFIAFVAGGELRISHIKKQIKSLVCLVMTQTVIVFVGVGTVVFFCMDLVPALASQTTIMKVATALIFATVSVALSPASAIAIINETKAKGFYTDLVLSVTIATDIMVILLFGIIISVCQSLVSFEHAIDLGFFAFLIVEIVLSLVLGFLLGRGIIFLIKTVKIEFPVVIAALGFFVIKFSHFLGGYFKESYDLSLNLEPLLICIAAGFTVQNFSKQGGVFLSRMNRASFPVFVAFFALAGASIKIEVLKTTWFFGLVVVGVRLFMLFIASYLGGRLSKDPPHIYKNTWLGFVTQAGVSIGLLNEVVRRFPEIGISLQSILIAAITVNQIIGPIAFKFALNKVGETNKQRKARAHEKLVAQTV